MIGELSGEYVENTHWPKETAAEPLPTVDLVCNQLYLMCYMQTDSPCRRVNVNVEVWRQRLIARDFAVMHVSPSPPTLKQHIR